MKIGFLIESMEIAVGGPARVAAVISSGLADRGHEVAIATLPSKTDSVEVDPRVRHFNLAGTVRNPINWLRATKGIREFALQVDVLLVSGIWGPVDGLALRLANITQIPVHTRICGMLEGYILNRNPKRKWIGRKLYMDSNLRRSTSLIVNTEIEKEHVRAIGITSTIHVIPNGAIVPTQDERFDRRKALQVLGLTFPPNDRVLLYLSRIHPKKQLHVLLESLNDVFGKYPNSQMIVAGNFFQSEGYEQKIRSLADASGFRSRIHFVGEVAGERKHAALSTADLFVLPSKSEGFSNAVIEAMAWGIPVVITEGCNFPEVAIEGAGWIIKPERKALSEVLNQLLHHEEQLAEASKKAYQLIQRRYEQSRVIDLYEQLSRNELA